MKLAQPSPAQPSPALHQAGAVKAEQRWRLVLLDVGNHGVHAVHDPGEVDLDVRTEAATVALFVGDGPRVATGGMHVRPA